MAATCPVIVKDIIFSYADITGNSTDRFNGAVVELYCQPGYQASSGSSSRIVVCKNGAWDPAPITSCETIPAGLSESDIVIIVSCVVGFLLLCIVIGLTCWVCYRHRKQTRDVEDKRSLTDLSDSGYSRRFWGYGVPNHHIGPTVPVPLTTVQTNGIPKFTTSLRNNPKRGSMYDSHDYEKNGGTRPQMGPLTFFYGHVNPYGYQTKPAEHWTFRQDSLDRKTDQSGPRDRSADKLAQYYWTNHRSGSQDRIVYSTGNVADSARNHAARNGFYKNGYLIRKI